MSNVAKGVYGAVCLVCNVSARIVIFRSSRTVFGLTRITREPGAVFP